MPTVTPERLTAAEVIRKLGGAIVLYTIMAYIGRHAFHAHLSWEWAVGTATAVTCAGVARRYHRLSRTDRLTPPNAIGFALVCITLIVGPLTVGAAPARYELKVALVVALCLGLLLAAPVYLLFAGVMQLMQDRDPLRRRTRGT